MPPTTRTLKIWKNRQKKWIEQVLFPGYIFAYTKIHEVYHISRIPKIVTYIHCAGKPSVIPSREIEGIKKMLNLKQEVSVESNYCIGEKVRVLYGPLAGQEGVLVRKKGKERFGIQLKEINHTVFIDLGANVLEKV